jgi:hypothetical protein
MENLTKFISKIKTETMDSEKMKLFLGEGLIMTHDIIKVYQHLQRYMYNNWYVSIVKEYGIIILTPKTEYREIDGIVTYMNNMGYYLSTYLKDDEIVGADYKCNDWTAIRFEAKFDMEYVPKGIYLYHVTEEKYLPKILKNGLIPKSHGKLSGHPDRIYLSITIDSAIDIMEQFKNGSFLENPILLRIDISGLYNKYMTDTQFNGGIYTTQNIPPIHIKQMKITYE